MKTLDEIFIENGTDKSSKGHNYSPSYELVLGHLRFKPIWLLEIGVGGGESIMSWLHYFEKSRVVGVDISPETNPWNTGDGEGADPRYKFVRGDQSKSEFWDSFNKQFEPFDVIIDDGGHFNDGVIQSFISLWPMVRAGGYYVVEDLACSYSSIFVKGNWPCHMDFLRSKVDELHKGCDMEFIYFAKEMAVLKKCS